MQLRRLYSFAHRRPQETDMAGKFFPARMDIPAPV